ncbi:carbohydrate-binding domain-containing protein [Striga asiatica]|uniref:Carbohydrate-binding domain-containing protein n=1 Tax=Striga asiatica TaxID=4170 RepID=A0A5A7PYP6_STRAF|nr:carbohydrate-binding domain-containing protein [Striga asiatica]
MKALWCSNIKFLTHKNREEKGLFCSREIALSRQGEGFSLHQKRVRDGFFLTVTFEQKPVCSISASSSAQANDETEETQAMDSEDKPKIVRVRFKLHKECAFGQQFLLVGDDPMVGLWDPSNGMPLIWSEGHVWTAEIDMPSGKVIKYKFLLKGEDENVTWQPGPDRFVETWYTDKVITVYEDWENPELQNTVEEEISAEIKNESLLNSNSPIKNGDNSNQLPVFLAEENDSIDELGGDDNDSEEDHVGPHYLSMVAENITEGFEGRGIISANDENGERNSGDNDVAIYSADFFSLKGEEKTIVSDEGVPVLVPGLISSAMEEIEEKVVNEVDENDETVEERVDEVEDSTEAELADENVSASMLQESIETIVNIDDQKKEINGSDQILDGDMEWGRRTLQKLLANFGFQ